MTNKWRIRTYKEGDETGIVELMNLVFPKSAYTIERWQWEYRHNPYGFTTIVCEHEGRIIGHMSSFWMNFRIGNQTLRGSQACDVCVHPDFRQRKIFAGILQDSRKIVSNGGIPFSIGFPNKIARIGATREGWFDIARIPIVATYFDIWNIITEKYPKMVRIQSGTQPFSRFADYFFETMRRRRDREPESPDHIETPRISFFDERVDELWNRIAHSFGNCVVRNHTYLNWRYFDRPDVHYDSFGAERKGEMGGYVVTSTQRLEKVKVGYIVDIIADSMGAFQSLIRKSVEFLRDQSVDSVECMMLRDKLWYKTLLKNGFTPILKQKQNFVGQVNTRQLTGSYDKAKGWYITYGDSDHV